MNFSPTEKATLARLADLLIPAGEGFLSATEAGATEEQLDQLLSFRPDLVAPLKELLIKANALNSPDALHQLRTQSPAAFAVLAEVVPAAYLLNPKIRAQLKYDGQGPRPIDPRPDYEDLLPSVIERGTIYRPTKHHGSSYDWNQSYDWNFAHAPAAVASELAPLPGHWEFAGRPVSSPLGIAAGPLLNGAWILYYATLGFDVLTYKTVRSRARACYPMPNLQPVKGAFCLDKNRSDARMIAACGTGMRNSWAVSFGMPSKDPSFWRGDIETTRRALPKEKLLSVSVVATPEPNWTLEDLGKDFAQCARWAVESGADCVEANFSCPNVASADAQLYQQTSAAATVAQSIRQAIGRCPLLIKVGHVTEESHAANLITALAPHVDGLVMVNCVSARVLQGNGESLFQGEKRGIAGAAIREAALNQIKLFAEIMRRENAHLNLIGVGGITNANDVAAHLKAGAQGVQLATAAMLDPQVGLRIREQLSVMPDCNYTFER